MRIWPLSMGAPGADRDHWRERLPPAILKLRILPLGRDSRLDQLIDHSLAVEAGYSGMDRVVERSEGCATVITPPGPSVCAAWP